MSAPGFNPETICNIKAQIGCDELYRWAAALATAAGSISGISVAFERRGMPIPDLAEHAEHLTAIRTEITDAVAKAMRGQA